jgi:hypothetical protein
MKKVVGLSLGLLALSGVARGDGGATDTGLDGADGGLDAEVGAEPEPPLQVCLCALHIAVAEPTPLPLAPALDALAVRARVLASLPPALRDRI